MKVCPKCKKFILIDFSYSDGILYCPDESSCGYVDDSQRKMRNFRERIVNDPVLFDRYNEFLIKLIDKKGGIDEIVEPSERK